MSSSAVQSSDHGSPSSTTTHHHDVDDDVIRELIRGAIIDTMHMFLTRDAMDDTRSLQEQLAVQEFVEQDIAKSDGTYAPAA